MCFGKWRYRRLQTLIDDGGTVAEISDFTGLRIVGSTFFSLKLHSQSLVDMTIQIDYRNVW